MRHRPQLIHPVTAIILTLDKEKSKVADDAYNNLEKIVYKKEGIRVECQMRENYSKLNRQEMFNTAWTLNDELYILVYTHVIFGHVLNKDGIKEKVQIINNGDFVKEIQYHDLVIPLGLWIRSMRPGAKYGAAYFHKLFLEDRETEIARDEEGNSIVEKPKQTIRKPILTFKPKA